MKSSAANDCITLLTNLNIEANSVDPDQSDLGPHCLLNWLLEKISRRQNQTTLAAIGALRVKQPYILTGIKSFCDCFIGSNQHWAGWVYGFEVHVLENPNTQLAVVLV